MCCLGLFRPDRSATKPWLERKSSSLRRDCKERRISLDERRSIEQTPHRTFVFSARRKRPQVAAPPAGVFHFTSSWRDLSSSANLPQRVPQRLRPGSQVRVVAVQHGGAGVAVAEMLGMTRETGSRWYAAHAPILYCINNLLPPSRARCVTFVKQLPEVNRPVLAA